MAGYGPCLSSLFCTALGVRHSGAPKTFFFLFNNMAGKKTDKVHVYVFTLFIPFSKKK